MQCNFVRECANDLQILHKCVVAFRNNILKFQACSLLLQKVMVHQSHKIGCVWKPGFLKSGHILYNHYIP